MSGLAGLLAGHRPPGVYRWESAAPAAEVRHTVEHAGWSFAGVDGWTHEGRAETLAALAGTLAFPTWFGHNLDALADCLADRTTPTVLLWDGWGTLARADAASYAGVVGVLAERAAEGPPFAVLLRGDGPEDLLEGVARLA